MNINTKFPVMVFRRDNEYGTFYQIGLSKKEQDGSYFNWYEDVKFKKDVSLENKAKIYIKNGWRDCYKNKNGEYVKYFFINEFETVGDAINESKEEDPFSTFGKMVEIDDGFLD